MEVQLGSINFTDLEDRAVVTFRFPDGIGTYVDYEILVPCEPPHLDLDRILNEARDALRERLEAHLRSLRY